MKKAIITVLIITGFISVSLSQVDKEVNIRGKIINNSFTEVKLFRFENQPVEVSKSSINSVGEFSLIAKIPNPDFYKLQFSKEKFIMMILKPGEKINITTDVNDFMGALSISGSEETGQVMANQRMIDDTKRTLDSISNLSYQNMFQPKSDSLIKMYTQLYEGTEKNLKTKLTQFVLNNKTSLAILFLPESFPVDDNLETYLKADSVLYAKYPENVYVKNLHTTIISSAKTAIGTIAPDFILPDTSGKNISLSSLRGKYVLIDFWASWCSPCMKDMPAVKKLYSEFKTKGFEILGVSLDKSRDSWINAIKNNSLGWVHVSDVKFWQSAVVPLYNVTAIPYTVIVDKDGRIIAKNLRGEALYKKVQNLLSN